VYDGQGHLLSSPPLPEIPSFDVVSSTRIFSHGDQNFYDPTTGALLARTGLPSQSVVAGRYVVSVSGQTLIATPF
jgi:hypothetical protein